MTLYQLARVIRSKNAGPFTLTIDLLFATPGDLRRALTAPAFNARQIAALYRVPADQVSIRPYQRALAVKVTMPRRRGAGGPGDRDVYGSQQHVPLGGIKIPYAGQRENRPGRPSRILR